MTTISTRIANLNDLETLLEFEQGVIKAERPMDSFLGDGTLSYYNIPELIASKNSHLIVAVANKELVGSGYLKIEDSSHYHKNPKHGYIGFIFVKPAFRGQRISNLILSRRMVSNTFLFQQTKPAVVSKIGILVIKRTYLEAK